MGKAKDRNAQLAAAKELISIPSNRPEDQIRQNLIRLLDAFGIDNYLSYPTQAGPADIYCPRIRTIIEAKKAGFADNPNKSKGTESKETPLQQLERYLKAEIHRGSEMLPLEIKEEQDRPWTGILTDGKIWHAWKYENEIRAPRQKFFLNFRPSNETELVRQLTKVLGDEPIGKPWVGDHAHTIFEKYRPGLDEVFESLKGTCKQYTDTKFELWRDMLRGSGMDPKSDFKARKLFVSHSFLVIIARGVIHTLAHPEVPPNRQSILNEGFVSWVIDTNKGAQWAKKILDKIHSYEWRRQHGDVLRSIYEEFIDVEDRKIFGEYYTPDWLAALLVEEVCDDDWCNQSAKAALAAEQSGSLLEGVGVLDPACGSGTFLYHAARKLMRSSVLQEENLPAPRKAGAIARLVQGIDIHPIAVEIARATLLRALPAIPPDGEKAVCIYQGDALMALEGADGRLFSSTSEHLRFATPKGREIYIPWSFAQSKTFATNISRVVQTAKSKQSLPSDILKSVPKNDRDVLIECHQKFIDTIDAEGNSVWAWFVTNITAPLLLSKRKVNRIVANPPWVKMADIQVIDRKSAFEDLFRKAQLWNPNEQAPHHDIAQLFVKQGRAEYLASPDSDPSAWVVKRAAIRSGNWKKFREWHKAYHGQTLDLDKIMPFGGGDARRSCVLFDVRYCRRFADLGKNVKVVAAENVHSKDKVKPEMNLDEANRRLKFKKARELTLRGKSPYAGNGRDGSLFLQGATITPKVLVVLGRVSSLASDPSMVKVTTVRSNKYPWHEIDPQIGEIPAEWARNIYESSDLLPFVFVEDSTKVIIPIGDNGGLDPEPGVSSKFWTQLDRLYREHRGEGQNTPDTLLNQIDYNTKLSRQFPIRRLDVQENLLPVASYDTNPAYTHRSDDSKRTVLYPSSGNIMRAARAFPSMTLIGSSLYRWDTNSEQEAAYLVAILNAPALRIAFVDSRESGRHFLLNPWRHVPIPLFDEKNADHLKLAKLTEKAEVAAERWYSNTGVSLPLGQRGLSSRIRKVLSKGKISPQIDALVKKILPEQVS